MVVQLERGVFDMSRMDVLVDAWRRFYEDEFEDDDKQVEIPQEAYKPISYSRDPYTLAMPRADGVK